MAHSPFLNFITFRRPKNFSLFYCQIVIKSFFLLQVWSFFGYGRHIYGTYASYILFPKLNIAEPNPEFQNNGILDTFSAFNCSRYLHISISMVGDLQPAGQLRQPQNSSIRLRIFPFENSILLIFSNLNLE